MALHRAAAAPEQGPPRLTEPILIPHGELSAEALHAVIESFVLREGTDYGEREHSLAQKVAQVRGQLERGQARIVFDPDSDSVTIEVVPSIPRRHA